MASSSSGSMIVTARLRGLHVVAFVMNTLRSKHALVQVIGNVEEIVLEHDAAARVMRVVSITRALSCIFTMMFTVYLLLV